MYSMGVQCSVFCVVFLFCFFAWLQYHGRYLYRYLHLQMHAGQEGKQIVTKHVIMSRMYSFSCLRRRDDGVSSKLRY
jgi:hypothetical protein